MGLLTGSSEESWKPSITSDTTARSYWLNWRVLLCGVWIIIAVFLASILIRKYEPFCSRRSRGGGETEQGKAEILYDEETFSPCLKGVQPAWLLGFRALAFALLLLMLIAAVVVDGPSIYYYYTQWTCTLITIYFGLGLLLSVRGCFKNHNAAGGERINNVEIDSERGISAASTPAENFIKSISSKAPDPHIDQARQTSGFWGYALQILFQVNAGAVVLTDCVFWLIIVPFLMEKHYRLSFLDINMHTINVVLLLIDAALNCLRFPLFRIAYFFSWTVFFVIFQWILHACVPIWWPYPFLDLSSRYAPIWYLSVALMHLPCYGVFALVIKLKHSLLARWFLQSYQYAR
ncbi:uncharacterized protein LOC116187033 [Punica granatum]|uniref:Uncharacterized protein n=2 Tax=Punica granatum TaxID=22663 RepID=A0A218Y132_PUNGR|nr:uncharacterized protein LOC116187033 [Punica granatum]OWM90501.1 hypothetical protein CDL15_Pgr014804 [Punica granatum]PKI59125.1 hypothetical protein CRG98_020491 [Punica granatum]